MTDRVHRPASAGAARRVLTAALAAAALIGGAACADDAEPTSDASGDVEAVGAFEASPSYLRQAADMSTAEGYRVEMRFTLGGEVDFGAEPLMSGEIDGERFHMTMDMASMVDQMAAQTGESLPPELAGLDLSMEMAGDSERLYLRAPIFAAIGEMSPGGAPEPLAGMAELGDGWGFVDLTALGEQLPSDVANALGAQAVDPSALVELIEGTGEVEDLGSDEIDGTQVHGLAAEVSLGELVEAQGQDADALAEAAGTLGSDDVAAAIYDITTPIEVWIGDDGYLRRIVFGYDLADIAEAMGESPDAVPGMQFSYGMDLFDYGASVEFTEPADAVDLTDAYRGLTGS